MRHRKKGKTLGRKVGPRKAMMRSLATSLVMHGKIKTTEAKAKALRPIIEKHITAARKNNLAVRRRLLGYYYNESAVKKLLEELGPLYTKRKGGYTRIIKAGTRQGDAAKMALIELIDYKKKKVEKKETDKKTESKDKKKEKK